MWLTLSFAALCLASASARVLSVHEDAPHLLPRDPSKTPAQPVFPDGLPRVYTCLKKDCEAICPGSFANLEQEYNCMYCTVWGSVCNGKTGVHTNPAKKARDIWLLRTSGYEAKYSFYNVGYPLVDAEKPGLRFHGINKFPFCVLDMCKDACPGEHLFPDQEVVCRTCLKRQVDEKLVKDKNKCTEPRVRMVFLPAPPEA